MSTIRNLQHGETLAHSPTQKDSEEYRLRGLMSRTRRQNLKGFLGQNRTGMDYVVAEPSLGIGLQTSTVLQ